MWSCTLVLHLGLLPDEFCGTAFLWISSYHCPFLTMPWVLSVLCGQPVSAVTLLWESSLCWSWLAVPQGCNSTCVFPSYILQKIFSVYSSSSLSVLTVQGISLSSFHMSGKNTAWGSFCAWCDSVSWSGCCQGSPGSSVELHIVSAGALCKYKDQAQLFLHLARILKGGGGWK